MKVSLFTSKLGALNLKTIEDYNLINQCSDLNWSFESLLKKFIKRFWKDPYREEEKKWIQELMKKNKVSAKTKFIELKNIMM